MNPWIFVVVGGIIAIIILRKSIYEKWQYLLYKLGF